MWILEKAASTIITSAVDWYTDFRFAVASAKKLKLQVFDFIGCIQACVISPEQRTKLDEVKREKLSVQ